MVVRNLVAGLPPVPRTPQQVVDLGWMDETPETSNMPQQPQQQQDKCVTEPVHGFATTNLDASGQGYPVHHVNKETCP